MSKEIEHKYFNLDELKRLNELEGKSLTGIFYYVWINKITENNPYVFIDKIKLQLGDNSELILSTNDKYNRIIFDDFFDFKLMSLNLKNEFEGKIILKEHNAKNDKFWTLIKGNKIHSVNLSREGNNYLADALILNFGIEKRLIGISPEEGLIIDFYEEV